MAKLERAPVMTETSPRKCGTSSPLRYGAQPQGLLAEYKQFGPDRRGEQAIPCITWTLTMQGRAMMATYLETDRGCLRVFNFVEPSSITVPVCVR